jgi:hypothetical protein
MSEMETAVVLARLGSNHNGEERKINLHAEDEQLPEVPENVVHWVMENGGPRREWNVKFSNVMFFASVIQVK